MEERSSRRNTLISDVGLPESISASAICFCSCRKRIQLPTPIPAALTLTLCVQPTRSPSVQIQNLNAPPYLRGLHGGASPVLLASAVPSSSPKCVLRTPPGPRPLLPKLINVPQLRVLPAATKACTACPLTSLPSLPTAHPSSSAFLRALLWLFPLPDALPYTHMGLPPHLLHVCSNVTCLLRPTLALPTSRTLLPPPPVVLITF